MLCEFWGSLVYLCVCVFASLMRTSGTFTHWCKAWQLLRLHQTVRFYYAPLITPFNENIESWSWTWLNVLLIEVLRLLWRHTTWYESAVAQKNKQLDYFEDHLCSSVTRTQCWWYWGEFGRVDYKVP